MSTVVRFEEKLDVFQNIVVLYRDESGKLFIGNTCFYNGRGKSLAGKRFEDITEETV